jgi:F0F1-type ATP synthase assembly protein I
MRRLLIIQIILVGMVTAVMAGIYDIQAAKSALFGGIIVLLNTGLMMLHEKRAAYRAGGDAQRIVKHVYLCAVERLILTLILFAVGFVALKLMPLPLLLGFIAGQLAAFLNGLSH